MVIRGSPARHMQLFRYFPSERQPLYSPISIGDAADNDLVLPDTIGDEFAKVGQREETVKFSTAIINRNQWPDQPSPAREAWLALHKAYVDKLEADPEAPLSRPKAPPFEQITFRAPGGPGSRNHSIMSLDDGIHLMDRGDSSSAPVSLFDLNRSPALQKLTDLLKSARDRFLALGDSPSTEVLRMTVDEVVFELTNWESSPGDPHSEQLFSAYGASLAQTRRCLRNYQDGARKYHSGLQKAQGHISSLDQVI